MSENTSARLPLSPPTKGGDENLKKLGEISQRNGLDPLARKLLELRAWLADELGERGAAHGTRADHDTPWTGARSS